VRREGDVWVIVNRERRRKREINANIRKEDWREYFMRLTGGREDRVVRGEVRGGKEMIEEEEISREEIKRTIGELKVGKAMGVDGIPNEVWKFGGEELEVWIREFCNRVWRGEGWPEMWKEGIIIPLVKKGEGEKVEDYRGITLMTSAYKIYVTILAGRIRAEVEEKGIMPANQTGFRKGMGTMDNIFTLNYLINKQLAKRKGMLVALFVDLKAAFDSVDRGVLIEAMRERGIREGLVKRVEEVMRETRNRVRVGREMGSSFWTERGVRQGCPLSPLLFNLVLADLEEKMRRVRWGGVKLGEEKVYSLLYADDMVLMAEEEEGMRSVIERLEGYLEEKRLEVNVRKTKVMRFRKGGGKLRKRVWRWRGEKLEEVKQYTYLGYTVQRNGGQEAHIRERVRKAAAIMGRVWGIGKRRFGRDWGRRLWLFDRLVWTVMGYGVEVWGWREREEMEKLEEKYLRWILGVDSKTPWYLVREELQREKLRGRAGGRAWSFERRLEEGRGGIIARKCWEEMRERERERGERSD